jgi:hypothetical protein
MAEFVSPVSSGALSPQIFEEMAEAPEPVSDVPPDGEAALCTYCLFPNVPDEPWCKRCGASISFASIVGPLDAARASGFMWRGALRGRPTRFVLVSVWLLFFPKLALDLLAAFAILTGGMDGPVALLLFWVALAFGAVAFAMLYQVTRNYLTNVRERQDESVA